jgi:uncharacterized membrane protein YesL
MNSNETPERRSFKDAFWDYYYDLGPLVTINILWFLLTLPVLTAFPAAAGLFYAANKVAHRRAANWRTFFEGFRQYFWKSYVWGLLILAVYFILFNAVFFYSEFKNYLGIFLTSLSITMIVIWTIAQLFTFPLLFEQEDQRIRIALRNSMVILIRRPIQTIILLVGVGAITFASIYFYPLWFFLTAGVIAYTTNRTVIKAIEYIRANTRMPEEGGESKDIEKK